MKIKKEKKKKKIWIGDKMVQTALVGCIIYAVFVNNCYHSFFFFFLVAAFVAFHFFLLLFFLLLLFLLLSVSYCVALIPSIVLLTFINNVDIIIYHAVIFLYPYPSGSDNTRGLCVWHIHAACQQSN